jgi:LAS superfamily LD-carboxypeptidase LdcB
MSIDPTPRSPVLTPAYLTGCDSSPLLDLGDGQRLLPEVADALGALVDDARRAGFDLRIASAWRSFERQRDIFNAKIRGERAVLDDADRPVDLSRLSEREVVHAILRFSALPGASRHHWGTDLDVFDAATLPAGGKPALSQAEVCAGGPC